MAQTDWVEGRENQFALLDVLPVHCGTYSGHVKYKFIWMFH